MREEEEKARTEMDNDSLSLSSHVSRESDSSGEEQTTFIQFFASEEEEYVQTLMDRETEFGFNNDKSSALGDSVKRARSEAIVWTLKARELFGFRFQTAYLSITYFDRFLSRRPITSGEMWLMKLLPVACLSLAAKMEEQKIPSLSDFRFDGDDFGTKLIEKMELFVLSTLEWKMSSITPFSYLHYFVTRLCQSDQTPPPTNLLTTTTPLIMATMREINLMEHRPSSMAAAATLVALDQKLTRKLLESKMRSISHCKSIQFEDVFSFYTTMSELKSCQDRRGLSSAIRPKQNDVLEASSVTNNAYSYEKKRLLNPRNCSFECGVTGYKRLR